MSATTKRDDDTRGDASDNDTGNAYNEAQRDIVVISARFIIMMVMVNTSGSRVIVTCL